MTQSRCLFISLVLAALTTIVVAAPGRIPQGRATGGEPFRSFRLLDQKLTLLSNQQSALKAALGAGRVNSSSNNSSSESATVILRRMSSTTSAIDRIAGRLELLVSEEARLIANSPRIPCRFLLDNSADESGIEGLRGGGAFGQ